MAMLNLFQEMENMQREMDDLFRGIGFGRVPEASFATTAGGRGYPSVNLREEEDHLSVDARLPGIDPQALEITVMGNTLTLAGERHRAGEENATWHRRERGAGRFLRAIDLPAVVDVEAVGADYQDGILTVTLPKAASARPKRIAIKAH